MPSKYRTPQVRPLNANQGFILTRQRREREGLLHLEFWLATDQGAVQLITPAQKEVFFIRQCDGGVASAKLNKQNIAFLIKHIDLKTFDQEPMYALYFDSGAAAYLAKQALTDLALVCFEDDIRLADRFLMERFICGSAAYNGDCLASSQTHLSFSNAHLKPCEYKPNFKVLSLDVECSEHGELYSIGLAGKGYQQVLMIGEPRVEAPDWIVWLADERTLLKQLIIEVLDYDPDIFVGWNVINFDFQLLLRRAEIHQIVLTLGRGATPMVWRNARSEVNKGYISMPGRVVIDGIDALKTATYQFGSFSLESVAQTLLGKGKKSENVDNRMAEITHNFNNDKVSLAEYNLQDCILVLDIFEHTALLEFLTLRSQLTGLEIDKVGGSVAAFINLYLPKLHRAGYVSPNRPLDGGLASPGGYVMDSRPGLYRNVLVFDFKSLYPSIIKTFKIDPLGLIEGLNEHASGNADIDHGPIPGYKGAWFSREKHFLPEIIGLLWQQRDEAKRQKDAARSQAIKILMNSFYGVLGSGGCPFYDTRLASSITMRGHDIMLTTAQWIDDEGYQVIYGDTDSIFVWLGTDHSHSDVQKVGLELQAEINLRWSKKLALDFKLKCELEIQFETHFTQFLMPTIRGSHLGSKKRYAGIKENGTPEGELIFKGLESVRSDWSELAKTVQTKLYQMVFSEQDVESYLRQIVADVLSGKCDEQLVYRKRLRRPLTQYLKNIPPHVKAARHADTINQELGKALKYQHKGWISYLVTINGPEAIEHQKSPIDYDHYITKQIKSVADGILPFIDKNFDQITVSQLRLFV